MAEIRREYNWFEAKEKKRVHLDEEDLDSIAKNEEAGMTHQSDSLDAGKISIFDEKYDAEKPFNNIPERLTPGTRTVDEVEVRAGEKRMRKHIDKTVPVPFRPGIRVSLLPGDKTVEYDRKFGRNNKVEIPLDNGAEDAGLVESGLENLPKQIGLKRAAMERVQYLKERGRREGVKFKVIGRDSVAEAKAERLRYEAKQIKKAVVIGENAEADFRAHNASKKDARKIAKKTRKESDEVESSVGKIPEQV